MAKFCKVRPDNGVNLFNNLKEKFGYETAWKITTLTTLPDFIDGKSFRKDSEGFPLMEDLLKDNVVRRMIGDQGIMKGLEKNFMHLDNSRDNYALLLDSANKFNSDESNKNYIALVESVNNKLKVTIHLRTLENENKATEQYSVNILNRRIADILNPIGITIDDLEEVEQRAGRIGVTDFTKINRIADSCVNVIRVANNYEGSRAISEEFSHLIIGTYRDEPLIRRALNYLTNEDVLKSILGNEYQLVYDFQDGDIDRIAEEALGKLLQENLLAESSNNPNAISSLLDRLYSNIKRKFKGINAKEIQQAVIDANAMMGQLAKNILEGQLKVRREKILKANRDAQFNSLSERIDANIDILKRLKDIEVKRFKISPKATPEEISEQREKINTLSLLSNGEKDTRIGIYNYAKHAVLDLKDVEGSLNRQTIVGHPSFAALRRARSYIQSYAGFIMDMRNAIMESKNDSEVPDFLTEIELEDGTIVSMSDIIMELGDLSDNIITLYRKYAISMVTEFFRPFFGNEIVMSVESGKNKIYTIEDIVKEATSDISILDMFLDSMSDSSDSFLQLFSSVVKNANDIARENTIKDSREVQRLMRFASEHNINDFEWIFEKDSNGKKSGNYISRLNYAKYNEDKTAFFKHLDELYGKNASGKNAKDKKNAYIKWMKENADPLDPNIPADIDKYQNEIFANLSNDELEFYKEFMRLKMIADSKYPDNRVAPNKAIQMRKSNGNRIIESISNPNKLFSNIKEDFKQTFLESEDDDQSFGSSKTSLMNFDNTEYMTLPVLFTNRLSNPEELSTDIFSALISYQFATNTYEQMDKIVDPLEVARSLMTDKIRKVTETRGDNVLKEKINVIGHKTVNTIYKGNSNIERKLNEFMESSVYQRYMKDEGTLFGTNLSVSKAGNWILHASSLAQLGFNWLANTANVTTGLAMTNIEAAAGEYFSASELFSADKAYFGMMSEFLAELGSRIKTNKLSLFDEFLNIKIDFNEQVKRNRKKNIFQKLFGENIAYLGQEGGDHWLYNRIAIAYCKHIKVFVPKQLKHVKIVRGLKGAEDIVSKIISNSSNIHLSNDEKFYEDNQSNTKYARVTSTIQEDERIGRFEETHKDGSPNNWITPSTNIGTGIDILVRDFFDNLLYKSETDNKWHHDNLGDELTKIYPNISEEDLSSFLDQLTDLKKEFDSKELTVVSKNIIAKGKITINDNGKLKDLNVAGTLDLLVYDKNGNFYIYDMKSHRGKVTNEKKHKWSAQLSLYKKFLEEEYGIRVKGLHILPIKVSYPTPIGEVSGEKEGITEYTVIEGTNQLLTNGKVFKNSSPKLESVINLSESKISIEYNSLGFNKRAITNHNTGDYNQMSLWDALQVVNTYEDRDDIKHMIIPKGTTDINGVPIDIKKISREIQDINIHLFGAYNQEDSNVANRVVLGRAIQQYRKWIKPQFNKRFQKAQINVLTGKSSEGYYRTFSKYYAVKFLNNFMNESLRGKVQIAEHWDELSNEERANIKRAWFEMFQCFCVYLIASYAPWPDDKNRPWALKFAEYSAKREMHELGMLTPSLTMLSETLKTVKSPMSCLTTIDNTLRLMHSLLSPEDWIDEKQSGPYKGLSTLEANFLKAPLPIVSQWRQIERFGDEIDTSINFYARPN